MKGLLILLTVLAVVWLLRGSRRVPPARREDAPAPTPGRAVQTLQRCAHCGMHLAPTTADRDTAPDSSTKPAKLAYCSVAHRLAGPRAPFGKR